MSLGFDLNVELPEQQSLDFDLNIEPPEQRSFALDFDLNQPAHEEPVTVVLGHPFFFLLHSVFHVQLLVFLHPFFILGPKTKCRSRPRRTAPLARSSPGPPLALPHWQAPAPPRAQQPAPHSSQSSPLAQLPTPPLA
ncbi:hypothetical protein GUJ93_ZPchr0005g15726 [Zizania palustris]|uniref:Uncharacterized protein n=1 Tax=Zizania palustris TaxID=103762 RepID=A0A8J5W1V5_ZIZPA|nr:hypothetical protein GUJ93_ZPchr0005g15726 [Zizania palustris]